MSIFKRILKQIKRTITRKRTKDSIELNTKILKYKKESDILRWSQSKSFYDNWNERTAILGDFILPNAKIIEFGAGNMFLKKYLKDYFSYTPSDIIQRFEETIVCDLNKPIEFDLSKYDTVVFSGVLEYVYDLNVIFCDLKIKKVKQIVISYCCSDKVKLSREKNGWLSDFTKQELESIFKVNKYIIVDYVEWNNQSLYNLKSFKNC